MIASGVMRRIIFVAAVCVVVVSCKRASSTHVDLSALKLQAATRMEHVLARPGTDTGFERLFAGIAADPEVRERGTALVGMLGADPGIADAAGRITTAAGNAPEMRQAVGEMMRTHPGATPDQIGELMSARIETNWSVPAINEAWMKAWNRLLPRLDLGVMPRIFATVGARFEAYVDARSDHWGERLTELNGGKEPTPERAAQLYMDHAWSEARLQKFIDASFANPRLQSECVSAIRRLLRVEAVRGAVNDAASAFLADTTVQDAAVSLIRQLTLTSPSPEVIGRDLDRMLQAPATSQALNKLMARVLSDPEVPKVLVDSLDHLSADPQLADGFNELLDRW
jgi:hypothetical protein